MFEINISIDPVTDFYDIISKECKAKIEEINNELIEKPFKQFSPIIDWLKEEDYKNLKRLITSEPEQLLKIYNNEIMPFNDPSEIIYTDNGIAKCTTAKDDKKPRKRKKAQKSTKAKSKAGNQPSTVEKVTNYWNTIFDYKDFAKNYSYKLAAKLGVSVCPYCNRQYTHTVSIDPEKESDDDTDNKRTNIIRPEFDHYFPQSRYPMFALSLYNLIPSCHVCNSNIKGFRELNINKHLHPYIQEDKDFKFIYNKNTDKNNIYQTNHLIEIDYKRNGNGEIDYKGNGNGEINVKAQETCQFFYLPEIYKSHSNLADEIVELANEYPPDRIENMVKRLNRLNCDDAESSSSVTDPKYSLISQNELLQLVYGKFIVKDENQEILGKLRKDLYEQVSKQYARLANE